MKYKYFWDIFLTSFILQVTPGLERPRNTEPWAVIKFGAKGGGGVLLFTVCLKAQRPEGPGSALSAATAFPSPSAIPGALVMVSEVQYSAEL